MLQKIKENIPFYVSLVFLVYPITYSLNGEYPFYVLPISLCFGVVYIALGHVENKYVVCFLWFMLLGIMSYLTIFIHPLNFLFMFYPSNLLVWKFFDNFKSYRFISFFIMQNSLIIYSLMADILNENKAFIFMFFVICWATYFYQRKIRIDEQLKEQKVRRNEQISLLIAENERDRIGRDLHDSLGHVFAMLTLKTELTLKQLERNNLDSVKKEIEDINNISKKAMADVRKIVSELKIRNVQEELSIISHLFEMRDISFNIVKNIDFDKIPNNIKNSLTMMLRECANNIIKHSGATKVTLNFSEVAEGIVVKISDNGVGFSKITGGELASIKNRVQALGGYVKIASEKNPTTVAMYLPYNDVQEEEL